MSPRQPQTTLDSPPRATRGPSSTRWYSLEDILLIILTAAAVYLPGLGRICLFDRDEPRFAEATREMLRTGNYLVPHFDQALRPDKPPLIYWLMSLTYRMVGINALGARLPSAICGTLTLLVIYWMAGSRFGRVTGVLAALMMSVVVVFIAESRLATADSTMIFFTTLAMACAWRAWDGCCIPGREPDAAILPKARKFSASTNGDILNEVPSAGPPPMPFFLAMIFWVAIAGGIMAKGVTLLFVFAALVPLSVCTGALPELWAAFKTLPGPQKLLHLPGYVARAFLEGNWSWWRRLRPAIGFPLLVLLTIPWFVAAWIATKGVLIEQMIGHHVLARATESLEHHGEPPGFYLVMVWATFWPWSVLLVPAAYHTVRRLRGRTAVAIDRRPYQFLVAYIVPAWIIYELIVTKLVHYVLPLYIPLAILCADTLVQSRHRMTDVLAATWFGVIRWVWMAVWLVGCGLALWATWHFFPGDQRYIFYRAIPFAMMLAATGIIGAIAWRRPAWPFATVGLFAAALMFANTQLVPNIAQLRVSQRVGREMRTMRRHGFRLAAAGYIEPTMVFYTHDHIKLFAHARAMIRAVAFAKRRVPGATMPVATARAEIAKRGPLVGNRGPVGSASGPRFMRHASAKRPWCVALNRHALNLLRHRHLRYFFVDQFRGFDIATFHGVDITLVTNRPWQPHQPPLRGKQGRKRGRP